MKNKTTTPERPYDILVDGRPHSIIFAISRNAALTRWNAEFKIKGNVTACERIHEDLPVQ